MVGRQTRNMVDRTHKDRRKGIVAHGGPWRRLLVWGQTEFEADEQALPLTLAVTWRVAPPIDNKRLLCLSRTVVQHNRIEFGSGQ